ncbi:RRP15-like protein [Lucilia cuprina]|uniref:RRP15-like protein n=1 Tax=Lucilia cuprina TaxID=7375 RepID=A0A0L0C7D1_LUCCU|nr:RRP15-like protein [Lucilia cuprina]KNC28151.1 RRP15-like protein [Lucilia cuprina]
MALSSVEKRKKTKVLKKQESESEQSSSADESSDEQRVGGNAGWADSIAKVLSTTKPKTKKTLVLSRAKKIKADDKGKVENDYGFEVDGEIKEEKPTEEELESSLKQTKNQKLELRVKPSWKDIERERTLRKVATRGVVQLFNAVRIQQKDLQHQLEEAGPLDSRKEAVLNNINKRKFLDVLMSGKRSKSEPVDNFVKDELKEESDSSEDEGTDGKKKKSEWSVLRDDFMTNKKIKHWDEEDGSDEAQSNEDDD